MGGTWDEGTGKRHAISPIPRSQVPPIYHYPFPTTCVELKRLSEAAYRYGPVDPHAAAPGVCSCRCRDSQVQVRR